MNSLALQPAAADSLAAWHDMVARTDLSALGSITHPDVVFRSPAVYKPYQSADVLGVILGNVLQVFEGFTYHREFASEDGLSVVLEFSAKVGDRELKGIDMIRFDEAGKIVEFEVIAVL